MRSVTLGIETSGFVGMAALHCDGEIVEERQLERSRRRHAQTLVSQVQALLADHSLAPADVTLTAVSRGPGSFTGLRVGIVFAKTFAWATGSKLVAVDTFAAFAESAPPDISTMSIVSDAQREQVFVGNFSRSSAGHWIRAEPIEIVDNGVWIENVAAEARPEFAVSGPGLEKIADSLPDSVHRLPETDWNPRASHVAIIAERLAAAGQFADPAELEPFYLRRSAAEEKRDAAASGL